MGRLVGVSSRMGPFISAAYTLDVDACMNFLIPSSRQISRRFRTPRVFVS